MVNVGQNTDVADILRLRLKRDESCRVDRGHLVGAGFTNGRVVGLDVIILSRQSVTHIERVSAIR